MARLASPLTRLQDNERMDPRRCHRIMVGPIVAYEMSEKFTIHSQTVAATCHKVHSFFQIKHLSRAPLYGLKIAFLKYRGVLPILQRRLNRRHLHQMSEHRYPMAK